ncbi:Tropinone reductase-like [Arachis hypogaea]|nr:Tropinone reductase-like [Arachis hypogaea]
MRTEGKTGSHHRCWLNPLCSVSPFPSGTGFTIAERLGLEGASVVISSRQQQNVDDATEKLRAKEIEVLALICHVSNDQQRKDLIQKIAQCGNIDVTVSNAAVNPSEINVKASILLLKDAAPHLHKGSSVVIISSVAGFNPPASMSMYEVTKTALFGLTKVGTSLALQSVP